MLQTLMWAGLAAAGMVVGWCASAWLHRQRIDVLQVQLRVMRQTMQANTDQARRQIGQLQADLATRPPAIRPPQAVDTPLPDGIRRKAGAHDRFGLMDDGFAQTAIVGDAFPATMLMR